MHPIKNLMVVPNACICRFVHLTSPILNFPCGINHIFYKTIMLQVLTCSPSTFENKIQQNGYHDGAIINRLVLLYTS